MRTPGSTPREGKALAAAFILAVGAASAEAAVNCSAPGIVCRSGVLSGDETWTASSVYVITSDLTVPIGKVLNIESGTIVKLDNPFGGSDLVVAGDLRVNGTPGSKVYFTAIRDDTLGGDTEGDGGTAPAAGHWGRIAFQPGATGTVQNAELRYGGYQSGGTAVVYLDGASPTLGGLSVKNGYRTAISGLATDAPAITGFTCSTTPICGLEIRGGTLTGVANWGLTWAGTGISYVVTSSLTVPVGRTLTIASGVVVKFDDPFGGIGLVVAGHLQMNGASAAKVYLTGIRDDSIGGDTNSDGSGTAPAAGHWGRIAFQPGATGTVQNAELRYGGYQSGGTGVAYLDGASPTLSNVVIKDGYRAAVSGLATDSPVVTGFACSATPICGLEIRTGTLSANAAWYSTGIVYVPFADLTISQGATLTVGPGVVVKFPADYSDYSLSVAGQLVVNGAPGAKTYFTVLTDDTVGGDTNGNGASSGSTGTWGGLEFPPGGTGTLDYAEIRFANNGLYVDDATVAVQNGGLRWNANAVYSTAASRTLAVVQHSNVTGNTTWGAYAGAAPGVDARWNWWGSASCPQPATSGANRISTNVLVEPCLAEPPVDPRATQTSLTSSTNPSDTGQEVTFEATVTATIGCPTGTVQFIEGTTNLGTPVALGACTGNAAKAWHKKNFFSPGSYAVRAEYVGVSPYVSSASSTLNQVVVAPPPLDYYTVEPCRVVDTRDPLKGAPAMVGGSARTFSIVGLCQVPVTAKAAAFNITVTGATGSGNCRLYPDPNVRPTASAINFTTGLTRANNAVAALAADGTVTVFCGPAPSVHVILDVGGYFE